MSKMEINFMEKIVMTIHHTTYGQPQRMGWGWTALFCVGAVLFIVALPALVWLAERRERVV